MPGGTCPKNFGKKKKATAAEGVVLIHKIADQMSAAVNPWRHKQTHGVTNKPVLHELCQDMDRAVAAVRRLVEPPPLKVPRNIRIRIAEGDDDLELLVRRHLDDADGADLDDVLKALRKVKDPKVKAWFQTFDQYEKDYAARNEGDVDLSIDLVAVKGCVIEIEVYG